LGKKVLDLSEQPWLDSDKVRLATRVMSGLDEADRAAVIYAVVHGVFGGIED
jgi:hypothetical protein